MEILTAGKIPEQDQQQEEEELQQEEYNTFLRF
jgi:hypothetical protein